VPVLLFLDMLYSGQAGIAASPVAIVWFLK